MTLSTIGITKGAFAGAVVAGHYVYFVPGHDGASLIGTAARYDVRCDFRDPKAWETFDVEAAANPSMKLRGFCGGTTDGRYVYFVPHFTDVSGGLLVNANPHLLRYDTYAPFGSWASWSTYDLSSIGGAGLGACGSIFDGKCVYVLPTRNGNSVVVQGSPGSFTAIAFDGQHIYLAPWSTPARFVRFAARSPRGLPALPEYNGSFH